MNKTSKNISNSQQDPLRDFIKYFSTYLADKKAEVDMGGELLKLGTKTNIVQEMEGLLLDPVKSLKDLRESSDESLNKIVVQIFSAFFTRAKEMSLVKTAYEKKDAQNITYFIVLVNDNFEEREKVFDFLPYYEGAGLNHLIPVSFQFVPESISYKFDSLPVVPSN